AHTTTGCGKQGFPSAQPYLSHTPGANPFCCMFFSLSTFASGHYHSFFVQREREERLSLNLSSLFLLSSCNSLRKPLSSRPGCRSPPTSAGSGDSLT
ncbi:hypothetical protein BP00DRAFT_341433, partial [Aspergillus indologenus CBS 114.80]